MENDIKKEVHLDTETENICSFPMLRVSMNFLETSHPRCVHTLVCPPLLLVCLSTISMYYLHSHQCMYFDLPFHCEILIDSSQKIAKQVHRGPLVSFIHFPHDVISDLALGQCQSKK